MYSHHVTSEFISQGLRIPESQITNTQYIYEKCDPAIINQGCHDLYHFFPNLC